MNPQKEIIAQFENLKHKFDKVHANDTTKSGKMVRPYISNFNSFLLFKEP